MIRSFILTLATTTTLTTTAVAIEYPGPGRDDPNMRTTIYKPSQRYLVIGRLKHQTTITFGKMEMVTRIAFGDPDAWEGQKADQRQPKNSIAIWPLKTDLTNMQVTTDLPDGSERVYHFALTAHDPAIATVAATACPLEVQAVLPDCSGLQREDGSAIYGLTFTYPVEEKAAAQAAAAAAAKIARQADTTHQAVERLKVDAFYGQRNWQYVAVGDQRIAPTEVSDNRRLTGFRYPGTLAMPAVFWLGPDGAERSILFDRLDDVALVKVRARVFRLRQGQAVLDLYNCDGMTAEACAAAARTPATFAALPFPDPGPDPRTGTTSPNVLRVINAQAGK